MSICKPFQFICEEIIEENKLKNNEEITPTSGIYLFKVNNENTGTMYEIHSKLTTKIAEQSRWCRSGVFIINF